MLHINLLPLQEKREAARMHRLSLIYEILIIWFIFTVVASTAALYARLTLEKKFMQILLESIPGSQKISSLNREIEDVNNKLQILNLTSAEAKRWSELLLAFGRHMPPTIELNSLIALPDDALSISGTAKTRADLISFKDTLATLPLFTEVDLPLRYLVKDNNIIFNLKIIINSSSLKITP